MTRSTPLSLILFLFFLNINAQQVINTCVDVISGDIHGHLTSGCTNDISITSTSTNGRATIISGDIKSFGKINITPGISKVRIIPPNENHPKSHGDRKTRVGNGNGGSSGTGDRNSSGFQHNHTKNNSLVLYPNPAKEFIDLSNYKLIIKKYQIINSQGRVLISGSFQNKKSDYIVSVKELQPGYYIINIIINTGETLTKLLIKQ